MIEKKLTGTAMNKFERAISMPAPGLYSANSTADFSAAARYNKNI